MTLIIFWLPVMSQQNKSYQGIKALKERWGTTSYVKGSSASDSTIYISKEKPQGEPFNLWKWMKGNHVGDNLEAALTIGTPGFGLEVATSITKWTKLRLGLDWMPKFNVTMPFDINTFSDGVPNYNFYHVQELLYEMTGLDIDSKVKMQSKPNMLNFKFLVDVYPFQNNLHWHFTAGFYAGNSCIATSVNDISEKPTLVALNIYNRAYEYFTNIDSENINIGGGIILDKDYVERLQQRFRRYGRMGMHVGDFKDGTPYIMEPAPDGTISAKAYVNHFKPYLGFGYGGALDPEKKWNVSVEAGILIWGGVPNVINRDYTTGKDISMTRDLVNVRGKVGSYIDFIKALPVFPAISFRLSYTIF